MSVKVWRQAIPGLISKYSFSLERERIDCEVAGGLGAVQLTWSELDNFDHVGTQSREGGVGQNTHTAFTASQESHITRPAVAGRFRHPE